MEINGKKNSSSFFELGNWQRPLKLLINLVMLRLWVAYLIFHQDFLVIMVLFNPFLNTRRSWSNGLVVKALDSQSRGTLFKSHSMAPRSTQPFFLLRTIKWVPGIPWDIVVKNKLCPSSGSQLQGSWTPSIKRGHKVLFSVSCSPYKGLIKVSSIKLLSDQNSVAHCSVFL